MNSFENEILTNKREYIPVVILVDIAILFIILFSLSVLVEQFMIRKWISYISNVYFLLIHY